MKMSNKYINKMFTRNLKIRDFKAKKVKFKPVS